MAFPAVAGSNKLGTPGNTAGTQHSVPLPASVPAGAFLAIFGRIGQAGTISISDVPSGATWNIVTDESDASPDVSFVAYRTTLAAGTEGGSSITFSHANAKMCAVSVAFTGTGDPANGPPFDASPAAVGTTNAPNPPSYTPAAGLQDYLWLAFGTWAGEQTDPPGTIPAGYTRISSDNTGTAGAVATNCRVDLLRKTNRATVEDPGTWTISVAASGWTAWTIAIEPPIAPTQTQVARISLAGGNTPDTRTAHKIKLRGRVTAAGAGARLRVALYEGATLRTGNPGYLSTVDLTTALADYTLAVADADAAAITSYANLELRVWGYDATGSGRTFEIDQLWLEVPAGTAVPTTPVAGSDAGAGADSAVVTAVAAVSGTDSGTSSESRVATPTISASDSASGADAGLVAVAAVPVAGSDAGAGTETAVATATLAASETGAGVEASTGTASASGTDVGTDAEIAVVTSLVASADTGAGADNADVSAVAAISGSDSGAGSETRIATSAISASDVGTGADSGARMAAPVVEGTRQTINSTGATSDAVAMPTTVSPGAQLMVFGRVGAAGAVAFPAGWTVFQDSSDASDDVTFWAYKNAPAAGTEGGTSVTVTHGAFRFAAIAVSVIGAENPATQPPQASAWAINSGGNPFADPPAVTPTGGSKDYLFFDFVGAETGATPSGSPSPGYSILTSNCATSGVGATSNVGVILWSKRATAASENPPSQGLSNDLYSNTSVTIAVHPGVPATQIAGSDAGSGADGAVGVAAAVGTETGASSEAVARSAVLAGAEAGTDLESSAVTQVAALATSESGVGVDLVRLPLADDFERYAAGVWAEGSAQGPWYVNFNGGGQVDVATDVTKVLHQKPTVATNSGLTYASLVTSRQVYGDFDVTLRMKTVAQIRTGSAPNAWERAWFVWRFVDNSNFYYLTLKTNGIEVGKRDPVYGGGQRFLPYYQGTNWPVGTWNKVRVRMIGDTFQIWVDDVLQGAQAGATDATFTDTERPIMNGGIGLYNEDAEVVFDDVAMTGAPGLTAAMPTTDTGASSDAGGAVLAALAVSGTDAGAGAETLARTVASADSGSGVEVASPVASVLAADTSAGIEGAAGTAVLPGSDAGVSTDALAITTSASGADGGSGSDVLLALGIGSGDSGSDTEAAARGAVIAAVEAGAGLENVLLVALLVAADTASDTEGVVVSGLTFSGADVGSGGEAGAFAAGVPGADAGSAGEAGATGALAAAAEAVLGIEASALASALAVADASASAQTATTGFFQNAVDAGAGADAMFQLGLQAADAGASVEGTRIGLVGAEGAAGIDALLLQALLAGADLSAGAETGAGMFGLVGFDAGTDSEASAYTVAGFGTDNGSGSEVPLLAAILFGAQASAGSEVGSLSAAAAPAGIDFGAGADLLTNLALLARDAGSSVEASAAQIVLAGIESGAGADASLLVALLTGSDLGASVQAGTTTIVLVGSDVGAGTETPLVIVMLVASDAGTDSEMSVYTVAGFGIDNGSGIEVPLLVAVLSGNQAGTDSEASSVSTASAPAGTDFGAGADLLARLGLLATDAGAATETSFTSAAALLAVSDNGAATDAMQLAAVLAGAQPGTGTDSVLRAAAIAGDDASAASEAAALRILLGGFEQATVGEGGMPIYLPGGLETGAGADALLLRAFLAGADFGADSDEAVLDALRARIVMVV